jgi:uncharacterized BrkB/YihY/UPF0761 family membrane protein
MKHVKVVVFLAAIVVIALLIFNLKKESENVEEVKTLAKREYLGIKLLDIFLGVLGLAFVGTLAGYIVSLIKGGGKGRAAADLDVAASGEAALAGQGVAPAVPHKKLALEKVLGRTGTKIFSIVIVIVIILVILAIVILLFAGELGQKFPFLQKFLENLKTD